MSSAATKYAFVGLHATLGHDPPQRVLSTSATRAPCSRDALPAPSRAADPAPRTIRSYVSAAIVPPCLGASVRRYSRPAVDELLAPDDARLVAGLRAGDDEAFRAVMSEYGAAMLRVALMYVSSRAVAEDVVQDAWVGVLRGIGRFEGRSSLKTWLFRIVANTAKTRGVRESRSTPFSSLASGDDDAVDPDRFLGSDERFPGHWAVPPEGRVLADEAMAFVDAAIERLPPAQRAVITLRDVQGFTSEEVRNALDLTETNQRVLLHRARSKVRSALEGYMR